MVSVVMGEVLKAFDPTLTDDEMLDQMKFLCIIFVSIGVV